MLLVKREQQMVSFIYPQEKLKAEAEAEAEVEMEVEMEAKVKAKAKGTLITNLNQKMMTKTIMSRVKAMVIQIQLVARCPAVR